MAGVDERLVVDGGEVLVVGVDLGEEHLLAVALQHGLLAALGLGLLLSALDGLLHQRLGGHEHHLLLLLLALLLLPPHVHLLLNRHQVL